MTSGSMKASADKTTSAQHLGLVCRSVKVAAGFVELELAFLGRWLGALQQTRNLGGRQRLEGPRRFQSLVQNLLVVDPSNLRGDRQVEAVEQGLDRLYRVTVENKVIAETLHAQHSDAFAVEHRQHFVGKAAKMRVHHVQRHLHGVKVEIVLARVFQHAQMEIRILVAGEADVAYFARLFRIEHGFHGTALGEDPVGVFQANDFVELHQINVIGLEAL